MSQTVARLEANFWVMGFLRIDLVIFFDVFLEIGDLARVSRMYWSKTFSLCEVLTNMSGDDASGKVRASQLQGRSKP